ncbi:MAG: histidine phosphatase family protein [Bacteroidia bacterium]
MKRLFLMRHAKSSWDQPYADDHSRSLNKRGRRDAPIMASKIKESGLIPDLILSSDSRRTIETSKPLLNVLGPIDISYTPELYLASMQEIVHLVQKQDNNLDSLMILAHNPGITYAFNALSNSKIDNMPTSAVACIKYDDEDFAEISIDTPSTLEFLYYPKMFNQ